MIVLSRAEGKPAEVGFEAEGGTGTAFPPVAMVLPKSFSLEIGRQPREEERIDQLESFPQRALRRGPGR